MGEIAGVNTALLGGYLHSAKIQQAIGPHARRPPDHGKEMQTAVVRSCLTFIRSCQNHFARHSEREKKTMQTEEEAGRQQQGMDRPGVRQVSEGSGKQGKMEETGCEIICGAPTTLAVMGLMMMMMMMCRRWYRRVLSV